jgi:hypothetical protein
MLRARRLSDMGREIPLDQGGTYDLSMVVAQSLIATGVAVAVEDEPETELVGASLRSPETKPVLGYETKGRPNSRGGQR